MLDSMLDHMHIIAVFSKLICIVAVATILLSHAYESGEIPHNVVAGMAMETIHDLAVATLSDKRLSSFSDNPIPTRSSNELYKIVSKCDIVW